jgi:hypothetical protein
MLCPPPVGGDALQWKPDQRPDQISGVRLWGEVERVSPDRAVFPDRNEAGYKRAEYLVGGFVSSAELR